MNAFRYFSGEEPARGDYICHQVSMEPIGVIALSKEQQQAWIVTRVVRDMVNCKCDGAENWKQAHYVNQMCLLHRQKKGKEND